MKAGLDATQAELDFITEMERLLESGCIGHAAELLRERRQTVIAVNAKYKALMILSGSTSNDEISP